MGSGRTRPRRLLKNSFCPTVLKGRGFKPRRKSTKIDLGFSRCGNIQLREMSFSAISSFAP